MPPRFAYWTILAGGLPTAFRAAERDELLPTFNRLKEKHPDAEMKYFARGKLWTSPAEMREAERAAERAARPKGAGRGPDWRPGGDHRDPRQRFKDAKKARNQDRRQQRWERKNETRPGPPRERPHGDPLASRDKRAFRPARPRTDRPRTDRPRPDRPNADRPRPDRPRADRPRQDRAAGDRKDTRGAWRPREERRDRPPRAKPHGDKLRGDVRPRAFQPKGGGRRFERNQEAPPRPPGPDREPPPARDPKPEPPPKPSEPAILPPGPPERGAESHPGGKPVKRPRRE